MKQAPSMPPVPPPPPTPAVEPDKVVRPDKTVKMQTQKRLADPNKVGLKQTILTGPTGLGKETTTTQVGKGLLSGSGN